MESVELLVKLGTLATLMVGLAAMFMRAGAMVQTLRTLETRIEHYAKSTDARLDKLEALALSRRRAFAPRSRRR